MTTWQVTHCDILECKADGLICSANPNLNLSGGVGGAFAMRYGDSMQRFLHEYLRVNELRYIEPGQAVVAPPCDSPFKAVAHAVSIDAFYDTDVDTILRTYDDAIMQLAQHNCTTLVSACLGCGYGRVTEMEFARVAQILVARNFHNVREITLVSTNEELVATIRNVFTKADS